MYIFIYLSTFYLFVCLFIIKREREKQWCFPYCVTEAELGVCEGIKCVFRRWESFRWSVRPDFGIKTFIQTARHTDKHESPETETERHKN